MAVVGAMGRGFAAAAACCARKPSRDDDSVAESSFGALGITLSFPTPSSFGVHTSPFPSPSWLAGLAAIQCHNTHPLHISVQGKNADGSAVPAGAAPQVWMALPSLLPDSHLPPQAVSCNMTQQRVSPHTFMQGLASLRHNPRPATTGGSYLAC